MGGWGTWKGLDRVKPLISQWVKPSSLLFLSLLGRVGGWVGGWVGGLGTWEGLERVKPLISQWVKARSLLSLLRRPSTWWTVAVLPVWERWVGGWVGGL